MQSLYDLGSIYSKYHSSNANNGCTGNATEVGLASAAILELFAPTHGFNT